MTETAKPRCVGDAQSEVDVALVRRALSNLVGNATRYAIRRSAVWVPIAEQPGGRVRIAVINEGATIADPPFTLALVCCRHSGLYFDALFPASRGQQRRR